MMRGKKHSKLQNIAQNTSKIAIFLEISKNRDRDFPEGQIDTKWDKYVDFLDQISVPICKYHHIVPRIYNMYLLLNFIEISQTHYRTLSCWFYEFEIDFSLAAVFISVYNL